MPEPVRVIGCGMLAREILAIRKRDGLDHIDLHCLPAQFHHHPERIAPALEEAIEDARAEGFDRIFVAYADCGSGGDIDRVCERHGVERIPGPHCFAFYIGLDAFEAADDDEYLTTFFITDFLARQFRAFLIEPLGLDRHPELRDAYFGHYTRALYLAQTDDPSLEKQARKAAAAIGLPLEVKRTGYGDLTGALFKSTMADTRL